MKTLSTTKLRELLANNDSIKVIDVRTEDECRSGIIDGATNINLMDASFAKKINELDKEQKYAIVCRSGNRSASAYGFMESLGFKEIYNVTGGMMSW